MVCWKLVATVLVYCVLSNTVPITKAAEKSHRRKTYIRNRRLNDTPSFSKRSATNDGGKNSYRTTNNSTAIDTSDLCRHGSTKNHLINSFECTKLKLRLKRRKIWLLKLRRNQTRETNGATRTLVIVKGNQEINSNYVKQHSDFRPVLKALQQRIKVLKARKGKQDENNAMKPGVTIDTVATSRHVAGYSTSRKLPEPSVAKNALTGKKREVDSYGPTEVTELRTSSSKDKHQWGILGTIHAYEGPRKVFPTPDSNTSISEKQETVIDTNEKPLSKLPLYDDRVLKEATSGLRIFVNVSSKDDNNNEQDEQDKKPGKTADSASSKSGDDPKIDNLSSSISVDDLLNDEDTKSSEKINRLLSSDKATDVLSKEIAQLLTDDPTGSTEDPRVLADDVAVVPDDSSTADVGPPTSSERLSTMSDISAVTPDMTVPSSEKSSPPSVASATQQCLAKRGGDSTQCSISLICCSVCCPTDSCPLKDIFKKEDIPEDCKCKRQIVCPGALHPPPVVSFPSSMPSLSHPHHPPTFSERPTSLSWPLSSPGSFLPPNQALVSHMPPHSLPGVIPPSHPAVFVGPNHQQIPTLIRHPALPYHVAQPILSPLNVNFHWPPHVIPHNPGFPPLFRPPMFHRRPYNYPYLPPPPIIHHTPMMHHPSLYHPFPPVHVHPHPVPVIIHPPPQPIVIHAPPPPPKPPPEPKPPPKPKPPPEPKPPPKPKPRGPPAPSFQGSDGTAQQNDNPTVDSPGSPPGAPPLVVVDTSKKTSILPLPRPLFKTTKIT